MGLNKNDNTIDIEALIYLDALDIVTRGKAVNIRQEVLDRINQGEYECNQIYDGLSEISEEVADMFNDCVLDMGKYLEVLEDTIAFDYDEAMEMDDRRDVVFNIKCKFNASAFIKDFCAEIEIEDTNKE